MIFVFKGIAELQSAAQLSKTAVLEVQDTSPLTSKLSVQILEFTLHSKGHPAHSFEFFKFVKT